MILCKPLLVLAFSWAALPTVLDGLLRPYRRPDTPMAAPPPGIAAEFVTEALPTGAALAFHPAGKGLPPAMTDRMAVRGRYSLEVTLPPDENAGCEICAATPMDLSAAFETGNLDFWVRGAEGDEIFDIGFLDDGGNGAGHPLQVRANSRSYAIVARQEWTRVGIPLSAFGTRGSYWRADRAGYAYHRFNWSGVRCLTFDIEKNRHTRFTIWVDEARIFRTSSLPR
jgi:hypothetical protein